MPWGKFSRLKGYERLPKKHPTKKRTPKTKKRNPTQKQQRKQVLGRWRGGGGRTLTAEKGGKGRDKGDD